VLKTVVVAVLPNIFAETVIHFQISLESKIICIDWKLEILNFHYIKHLSQSTQIIYWKWLHQKYQYSVVY